MKFDLEISVTDKLTQVGKDKLANIFFPIAIDDTTGRFNQMLVDYPAFIDISRFNIVKQFNWAHDIDPSYYKSHTLLDGDVSLSRLVIKRGSIIPFFTSGTLIFNRYPLHFSNNIVRLAMDYESEFDRFKIKIPDTVDYGSVDIITSRLSSAGIADIDNRYNYISSSSINIITIDTLPNTSYARGTIIISVDASGSPYALHASLYSQFPDKVCESNKIKTGNFSTIKSSMSNGDVFIDVANSIIIIKDDGVFYNYKHRLLFKKSKENYLFTTDIDENGSTYIYLNIGLTSLTQYVNTTLSPSRTKCIFFDSYPVIFNQFTVTNVPESSNYTVESKLTLMRIINNSGLTISIIGNINYFPVPVITYKRITNNKDIKHLKLDVSPKSVNFGDGILCFTNAEVNKMNMPTTIDINIGDGIIRPMSSKAITVSVLNSENIPLANKAVKLTLDNDLNGMIEWGVPADETKSIYGYTNLVGEYTANIINANLNTMYYVQKEWTGDIQSYNASGFVVQPGTMNKIYMPIDLGTTDPDKIYLFIVTADDPIVSQIGNTSGIYGISSDYFSSTAPFDYYTKDDDISTYSISGRKIAYVSLSADQLIDASNKYSIKSTFIKPTSIQLTNSSKQFYGRNLFIFSQALYVANNNSGFPAIQSSGINFTTIPASNFSITSSLTSGFNSKWLLTANTFNYFKFNSVRYTTITYSDQLPGLNDNNVLGYFIRVQRDNLHPSITATHTDEFLGLILSQATSALELQSAPANESSFTLSTEQSEINSYIGPYSYLTISDYLSSRYGTNYATYVCKHSTRIISGQTNRCSNFDYAQFYLSGPDDTSNLYCKRNIQFEKSLSTYSGGQNYSSCKCPGLDPQLINPFLMYVN